MPKMMQTARESYAEPFVHAYAPTMQNFHLLLTLMYQFVSAEQALEADPGPVDRPEFDALVCEAEVVRADLVREAEGLLDSAPFCPGDKALHQLSFLVLLDLTMTDSQECRHLHRLAKEHPDLFAIDGTGSTARQTRVLQASFFQLFDDMGSLAEFGGDGCHAGRMNTQALIPA